MFGNSININILDFLGISKDRKITRLQLVLRVDCLPVMEIEEYLTDNLDKTVTRKFKLTPIEDKE